MSAYTVHIYCAYVLKQRAKDTGAVVRGKMVKFYKEGKRLLETPGDFFFFLIG